MGKIRKGIKMRVNPEQSRKVQEICFENGIGWVTGKILKHLDQPFLFIDSDNLLSYENESSAKSFYKNNNEEVSAELFIRTNGTCVESETSTENNNKGEQMEELKLECLVEGYEGTYFEVGQVWETREGERLKIIGFDFVTKFYKITMQDAENPAEECYYSSNGRFQQEWESDLDLVRLISTEDTTESIPLEEPQPKTLSEYLKENNAYESFVENSVEYYLQHIQEYKDFSSYNRKIKINNVFLWEKVKQGNDYWYELNENRPKNLEYDMNEIIFAEVDRRIAEQEAQPEIISAEEFVQVFEQKSSKRYMVFVEGRSNPKKVHDSYDSAEKEAKRLSTKEIGCNVFVVEIVKTFKSKVIVEEIK